MTRCTCFSAHWCDKHMKISIVYGVLQDLEEQRKMRAALESPEARKMIDADLSNLMKLPLTVTVL